MSSHRLFFAEYEAKFCLIHSVAIIKFSSGQSSQIIS